MTSWQITINSSDIIRALQSMEWELKVNRKNFTFNDKVFGYLIDDLGSINAGININFPKKQGFVYPITSSMMKAYTSAPPGAQSVCPSCGRPL